MDPIDVVDIQGLIARGYASLTAARYLMLKLPDDPAAARAWLASALADVRPGRPEPTEAAVNVAFTRDGINSLGVPARLANADFSPEFLSGLVEPHRSRILGDTDESAPAAWAWGGPGTPPVHAVLLLFAKDDARLDALDAAQSAKAAAHGLTVVTRLETSDLGGFEHFGFRDGISQPVVEGLSSKQGRPADTIKPGEVLLGYPNQYGQYTERPLLDAAADPAGALPRAGTGAADLGRNGSYLVFRTLRQDVAGFHRFLDEATRGAGGGGGASDPAARDRLAAKMVGRWKGGAPLAQSPNADDPALWNFNDFTYHAHDRAGHRCPIGAHVRRANPRDSLDPEPGSAKSVALNKHHRLLRRGREYGPPVEPHEFDTTTTAMPADQPDRGLHFLCFNGNLSRQFEFVQYTWLNNPKFDGLYDDADPLVGARGPTGEATGAEAPSDAPATTPRGATFTIQAHPVRRRVCGLPRFVTVRGGAYFFMPGIRALNYLAQPGAGT